MTIKTIMVRVTKETKDNLDIKGKKNQTYNEIITELINSEDYNLKNFNKLLKQMVKSKWVVCDYCKKNRGVVVHHIDKNRNNNSIDNLSFLCNNCHLNIHKKNHRLKMYSKQISADKCEKCNSTIGVIYESDFKKKLCRQCNYEIRNIRKATTEVS